MGKLFWKKLMSRAGIKPTILRLHVRLRYHYVIETCNPAGNRAYLWLICGIWLCERYWCTNKQ